jgi:hypothetical protein
MGADVLYFVCVCAGALLRVRSCEARAIKGSYMLTLCRKLCNGRKNAHVFV